MVTGTDFDGLCADAAVQTSVTARRTARTPNRVSSAPCTVSSVGRSRLTPAHRIDVAVQEVRQERADRSDRGDPPDLVPGRRDRRLHDIGGELEREAGDEPVRETQPDRAHIGVRSTPAKHETQRPDECPRDADRDDQDRDRLDGEREVTCGFLQQGFHAAPLLRLLDLKHHEERLALAIAPYSNGPIPNSMLAMAKKPIASSSSAANSVSETGK